MNTFALVNVDREQRIALRLGITDLFTGTTTLAARRERVRAAIIEQGRAETVCAHTAGRPAQSFRQAFQRMYGELLEPRDEE